MIHATVAECFRPAARTPARAYDAAVVLGGAALIALSAHLRMWIGPVPVTGQTFVVLLVGALLGSRRGVLAVAGYLLAGLCGLGVFAGGAGGVAYLRGATAGYLLGFLGGAWVIGRLAELGWDRRLASTVAAMALGEAVVFLPGVVWLATFVGWSAALWKGLVVFLPVEVLKIALAAVLLPTGWRLLGRLGRPSGRR